VELVMRKHPMRVQPLGGASSIRQSRIPSIATTSGPPEAIPPPPVSSVTVPPAFVAAPPPLAEATIPPTIANSAIPSRIYLGVEASKAQLVEAAGYFTHKRKNIAVSRTQQAARDGCSKWHQDEACVVFEVLVLHLSDDIEMFTNNRGCTRLNTKHVPARLLRRVLA